MSNLSVNHLLGIKDLTVKDIELILETATSFKDILNRPIKKVPALREVTIANVFFENSTRTRLSFELAEKRLSAKTGIKNIDLSVVGSALITQYRADELQSFSHAVIIHGQTDQNITIDHDATGHNFWSSLESVEDLLPSCKDITGMIDNKLTWLEYTYTLK